MLCSVGPSWEKNSESVGRVSNLKKKLAVMFK